jgi:hypothetical protein
MMNDAIEANDREPLLAVDDPVITVLGCGGGEHLRIGAALWLGHRKARHDAVVQQRLEVPFLQLRCAVVREDLAVSRIGGLRAEHDRRTLGPAENLVQQGEFHLAVTGATQMRAEVGGPQSAVLHDLLQRRNECLPHRIVEVVRLLDDQIDRFAFRADEVIHPCELLRPLGVCREVPRHG